MDGFVPTEMEGHTTLVPLELLDQVIIPSEFALNSGDLISIAIRDAEIPLRSHDIETTINHIPQPQSTKPPNTLTCKHCPFTTSYKEYLTRHMRSHNAKQFSCKICAYKTNSESGFKNHKVVHEDRLVKSCRHKYCTAKCKMEGNKKKFESVIKRLFNCEVCDYATENHELFSEHTKQHCDDLQFNLETEFCVICRLHVVKGLMNEHMRIHALDE